MEPRAGAHVFVQNQRSRFQGSCGQGHAQLGQRARRLRGPSRLSTRTIEPSMQTPEKAEAHHATATTPPKGISSSRRRPNSGYIRETETWARCKFEWPDSPKLLSLDGQAEPAVAAHARSNDSERTLVKQSAHGYAARQSSTFNGLKERLREFSILSPHQGAAAASYSWEDLPLQLQNALGFLQKLPAFPQTSLSHARPFLPPSMKPTLVLDLDETLVHCCRGEARITAVPDVVVEFDDGISIGRVHFRPFVHVFLEVVAKTFEVVIFTASQQLYADQVIDALDPARTLISHRLYRQHCTEFQGAYFKELSLLGRPLCKCVLVDNSPISVACNAQNGVLIRSWYGDLRDQELLALLEVLEDMRRYDERIPGFDRYLSQRYGLTGFFQALHDFMPNEPE